MRSLIHRVAAAVFIGISVTHLVSLIVNRKLREHWKEMLPNMNDPREALSNFAYNLGSGRQRRRAVRRTATSRRRNTGLSSGAPS